MIIFSFLLPLILTPIWLPWIGKFLVVADHLQKADALVILAGDENERIAAGARIFKEGYAGWFILTDMRLEIPDSQGNYSANVTLRALEQGVPVECILIVPGQASTTYEEVLRLKEFTLSQGFRSLIVVTSPYHTRRAHWLLQDAFRVSGVTLSIQPAATYTYKAEAWWRNQLYRRLTALEYTKMLAHLLGCQEKGDCGPITWEWLRAW